MLVTVTVKFEGVRLGAVVEVRGGVGRTKVVAEASVARQHRRRRRWRQREPWPPGMDPPRLGAVGSTTRLPASGHDRQPAVGKVGAAAAAAAASSHRPRCGHLFGHHRRRCYGRCRGALAHHPRHHPSDRHRRSHPGTYCPHRKGPRRAGRSPCRPRHSGKRLWLRGHRGSAGGCPVRHGSGVAAPLNAATVPHKEFIAELKCVVEPLSAAWCVQCPARCALYSPGVFKSIWAKGSTRVYGQEYLATLVQSCSLPRYSLGSTIEYLLLTRILFKSMRGKYTL